MRMESMQDIFNTFFLSELKEDKPEPLAPKDTPEESRQSMKQFIFGNQFQSTQKKTERDTDRFAKYLFDKHRENRAIEELDPGTLCKQIGEWLMSLCTADGCSYEPDTLTEFHRSIDRYLRYHDYHYSLVTNNIFKMSKEVLLTKRKQLSSEGLSNKPNKSGTLSPTD